jgi:hypothetical protein
MSIGDMILFVAACYAALGLFVATLAILGAR